MIHNVTNSRHFSLHFPVTQHHPRAMYQSNQKSSRNEENFRVNDESNVPPRVENQEVVELLRGLHERLDRLEQNLAISRPKDAYTTQEAAERLKRSEWTVRQWCNNGQVPGARKIHGKGRTGEWRISHDDLMLIQREGPRPRNFAAN